MVKKAITYIVIVVIIGLTINYSINGDYLNVKASKKPDENIDKEEKISIKEKDNKNITIRKFIKDETNLNEKESDYLVSQSQEKGLDIFMILGLIKLESNFNDRLVGTSGERGLGQIMDITGRQLAENMGLDYHPDLLFDSKYNIRLFTTHLSYLIKYYDSDIHRALTAYNRGQNGLKKYIASRGNINNPARSIYSSRVIELSNEFKVKFHNYTNKK